MGGRYQRAPVSLMAAMRGDFSSRGEGINGPRGVFARPVGPRWSRQVALAVALVARPSKVYQMLGIPKANHSESCRGLAALFSLNLIFRSKNSFEENKAARPSSSNVCRKTGPANRRDCVLEAITYGRICLDEKIVTIVS